MRPDLLTRARPALDYLLRLALGGGGYEFLGVRGWAGREEVASATGDVGAAHLLSHLYAHTGWLDREDVHHPARTAPVWIYRITEEGVRALDGSERPVALPAVQPGAARPARRFFLPLASADALSVLDLEARSPSAPAYVEGETGWLSTPDLSGRTERLGPGRRVYPDDLGLLVRAGLAERRTAVRPGGRAVLALYRITRAGAESFPLSWREPRNPAARPAPVSRLPLPPTR